MSSFTITSRLSLRIPPARLWEFMADTDRLNPAIGIPVVNFTPEEGRKGYYTARMRYFGIPLHYEEFPFDFVKEQFYEVTRRFPLGFLRDVTGGIRMAPEGEGTLLEVYGIFEPKNILSSIAARTILYQQTIGNVAKIARKFETEYLRSHSRSAIPAKMLPEINETQFNDRLAKLEASVPADGGITPERIQQFHDLIAFGSAIESSSMRPFELADRWLAPRYDVLSLFLYAAHAGIVDLHWAVLCPNCNVSDTDSLTLEQLRTEHHCETCGIDYGADLANSVEARFSVNQSIRKGRTEIYCIGGPANTPQVISQLRVQSGESRNLDIPFPVGTIRVRSYQTSGVQTLIASESAIPGNGLTVSIEEKGISLSVATLRSGTNPVTIVNNLPAEALVVIENETWKQSAATAAIVTSLQDFKDLFPQEAVAPGEEIGIGAITLLFTDLKGSTTLYKRVGDTPAFNFVQNHFRFLTEHIARNHGGVFKTMGDAVMASFPHGGDAVKAAVEMQQQWEDFRREYGDHDGLQLKVGIHSGSAIAINNRGRMDCFGSTVNIASHLQKLSLGGDIIVSKEVRDDPEVVSYLHSISGTIRCESYAANLKGYQERTFEVCKITPTP